MKDNVFIDTNILIYAYSIDEAKKRGIVQTIFAEYQTITISTQVINEFINVMIILFQT
jgi:predicted nucleic acid-binding protein